MKNVRTPQANLASPELPLTIAAINPAVQFPVVVEGRSFNLPFPMQSIPKTETLVHIPRVKGIHDHVGVVVFNPRRPGKIHLAFRTESQQIIVAGLVLGKQPRTLDRDNAVAQKLTH